MSASAESPVTPGLRIAILGDPIRKVEWTDDNLEQLRSIGFNAIQLNIAWGTRPHDEALNLADILTLPGEVELDGTAQRRTQLHVRAALAKKHGLRPLLHFGSPYTQYDPQTGRVVYRFWDVRISPSGVEMKTSGTRAAQTETDTRPYYDITNPKVREHELALLKALRREFPEVEDILVYSYDQDAWQVPEFQYTEHTYGVPLSERLAPYLEALHRIWTEGRERRSMIWWEPWELSAGQVYAILPKLPRRSFGLMLHSNIAEVQLTMPVDVWFRNTARMAFALGIPVVAEGFFSSATEELEPLLLPAPRLVDAQYLAVNRVPGVVGIKEYYGVDPSVPDLNLASLRTRLQNPALSTEQLLERITVRFGALQADILPYLEAIASALEVYPWDASWFARRAGTASIDHGWSAATVQGADFNTPAWKSTRHAHFMRTEPSEPHFWMREDVQLRCQVAADWLDRAHELGQDLPAKLPSADQSLFLAYQSNIETLRRIVRSYALHLRETNVAQMLRQDLEASRPMTATLARELGDLLDADVENQSGQGRVLEMRRLYRESPKAFIERYLLPTPALPAEKGPFTLTTR
jgi:hypothetical protein